ncbi:MAG: fumarylacetoacetate hydrolase family protein [Vicinamibacterales bacterium]
MSTLRSMIAFAALGLASNAAAQTATPFKLGTFERAGKPFVGVVLRDTLVIDLAAAHAAVRTPASSVTAPVDMKDLIERYDAGVRTRIGQIVGAVEAAGNSRPGYVHQLTAVKILPPIMYPRVILNAAVNYTEHDAEMARRDGRTLTQAPGTALPNTRSAPGIWTRADNDTRWNPYMFLKSPSAVVADGETIRLPVGREQVDWECELGVVIGRTAHQVPLAQASNYIFGYTLENDVSDRGGRGDTRHGSDWLIAKSHDTFAPMGPFIVPKEFVPNVKNLAIKVLLNDKVMQEGNTSQMIHDVFELVSYGTSILTLRAGDVIATGTPPGVGSALTPPVYLKAGDKSVCTYEGIGTLTNPVGGPPTSTR